VFRRRGPRPLSARILVTQLAVLVITGLIGFGLWTYQLRHELYAQYEQRALAIAQSVASMPEIRHAIAVEDPHHVIQPVAQQVTKQTGARYVVVIDRNRVRFSHPNVHEIGQKVSEPLVVLDGKGHTGIDPGSLGLSANGKAPIFANNGKTVIGEVSVGVEEGTVSGALYGLLPGLAGYLAIALAVGIAAAYLLARRLKRQTFGLELDEIATLVQDREATLHGIREGVVALDAKGRVTLMNDQAGLLLGIAPPALGKPLAELVPQGWLRTILEDESLETTDQTVLVADRLLVVSRTRVRHRGRELGSVLTMRDRTELDSALRELDEVRSLTDALRAQQHEFANRMHVVAGLLELGDDREAMRYVQQVEGVTADLTAELGAKIGDARLVGLLLAKNTVAAERGVTLEVSCVSRMDVTEEQATPLVSILGNLIDNAIDAVTGADAGRLAAVTVRLAADRQGLVVDVADSGPGIPADVGESIFSDGWSTKATDGGRARGLGLALVRQLVDRLGGTISVQDGPGARFRVRVPRAGQQRTLSPRQSPASSSS
jgi:Signal transduction histidine kinase regulating citrate/malate metabolism